MWMFNICLSMRALDVVLKKYQKLTFPVVLDTSTNNQTTSYKKYL